MQNTLTVARPALSLLVHLTEKVIVVVAVYWFALVVHPKNDARYAEGETTMRSREVWECICSRATEHFFLAAFMLGF